MVLSSQDLIPLQELAETFLPDDCLIERPTLVGSAINLVEIDTVKSLNLPPQRGTGTIENWNAETDNATVLLPVGANIQEGDIITIKGQRMTVQKLRKPTSYEVLRSIEASEIQP